MKKQNLRIFVMFGLFAILAVASVHAQSRREQTANIPFSFTVADKTFPAGEYNVTRLNPQSDKAVIAIKSEDGRLSKIVLTMPVLASKPQERAKLVFNHYGDQYFLVQVWTPADNTGLELPPSRNERALARSAGQREPERTTIALNMSRK
ncbi:MAG TPA: hypothetical protein VEV81_11530 [Pyrinomonadaceae bacterium]|nr:hypothetical protein [Pyrinomonadaceae bacterium]